MSNQKRGQMYPEIEQIEPYEAFEEWCRANGYADVADAPAGETDLDRLHEAIERYAESGEPEVRAWGEWAEPAQRA